MLKLEDIMCEAGVGKVFYNKEFDEMQFRVEKIEYGYRLLGSFGEITFPVIACTNILEGFYTKD